MKNRAGFTLADSLLALIIVSGAVSLYLMATQTANDRLMDSRNKMERNRERYEQIIIARLSK